MALLEELDEAFRHVDFPEYDVRTVEWKCPLELSPAELANARVVRISPLEDPDDDDGFLLDGRMLDRHDQVAVPVDDPIPHYRRSTLQARPRVAGGGGS